jgi:hypothetical protein
MLNRIVRTERAGIGIHRGPGYAALVDVAWDDPPPPRPSLAHRLETSRSIPGKIARWLFIKGGMVVVVLPALILVGLVGAFLGKH